MHEDLFFSNGTKVSLSIDGEATVDLKDIEHLQFEDVAKQFLAVSNASLCIEMPSAEIALGVELGYAWTREGRQIQQDFFGSTPRIRANHQDHQSILSLLA